MRSMKSVTAVVLAGVTALSFSAPAMSAPLMNQGAMADHAPAMVEHVQWRRHYYHGGPRYYRHGGGGGAGALIGGLAAGAIIGGAIAASQANAAAQQNASYCAQRYRSYDPASGTYLNNDGHRYPCP